MPDEESPLLVNSYHGGSGPETRGSWLRQVLFDRRHTPGQNSEKLAIRWTANVWNVIKATLLSSKYIRVCMPPEQTDINIYRPRQHPACVRSHRPHSWQEGMGPDRCLHLELPGYHSPGCCLVVCYRRDLQASRRHAGGPTECHFWQCRRAYRASYRDYPVPKEATNDVCR